MRARWMMAAVAAVMAVAGAGAPPAQAGRPARSDYVATNEGVVAQARFPLFASTFPGCLSSSLVDPPLAPNGAGGACFDLKPGDAEVRVRIDDLSGLPVGAVLYFVRSPYAGFNDRYMGDSRVAFCGRTSARVPTGAASVHIELGGDNDLWASHDRSVTGAPNRLRPCGDGGGVPVAGTVHAYFVK